ncbi:MAG: tyrosine-type recombinase/integrase [Solirubrobacteraceae bacterium]
MRLAVDVFLSQPGFSPMTVRSYRQTLGALLSTLDDAGVPSAEQIEAALTLRWGTAAPATWNRHVATVRSFLAYSERHRLLPVIDVRLDRRREHEDRTRSIAKPELERIWALRVPVREKALWRLLYDTAARASEALALDIEDLDLANRCARITGKGAGSQYIYWQTRTARLLPLLIAGRPSGPLFTTARKARLELAAGDLCPHTGQARLSYRRAGELFKEHTGRTLHQLRHSALTHLAEDDVALPMLMAVSRHTSLRSLQRYARPGPDAVARLSAQRDPERRGRRKAR